MKKLICCFLVPMLLLAVSFLNLTTGNPCYTNTDLLFCSAGGEEIHIPKGTFTENNAYYNFYDNVSHKTYDVYRADTDEFLRS